MVRVRVCPIQRFVQPIQDTFTRRLVDVSQDLIIRETDCSAGKAIPGMYVSEFVNDKATASSDAKADILESLEERITGRYLAEDIIDPSTGEVDFSCKTTL